MRQHLLQHLLSRASQSVTCARTQCISYLHLLLWALSRLQRFFHLVLQHPRQHLLRSCQSMLQHHPRTVHVLGAVAPAALPLGSLAGPSPSGLGVPSAVPVSPSLSVW